MGEKSRVTLNLSTDNVEWVDQNYGNRSRFVNDLINQYRQGTSEMNEAVARFRYEQLNAQEASLEARLESIRSEKETVSETLTTQEERRQDVVEQAARELTVPADPENLAIIEWADRAEMPVEEFVEAYKEAKE